MTMTTERRNVLKAASAAAVSTAVLPETQAFAQGNLQAAAKAMPYQAKPMPFDPKTGISEKVLTSHYENNYVGAVKRLNAIGTQLAELDFAKAEPCPWPSFGFGLLPGRSYWTGQKRARISRRRSQVRNASGAKVKAIGQNAR